MTKLIYNYDQDGYYISTSKSNIDPLESKKQKRNIYLLPQNATFSTILPIQENKLIKWDRKNSSWLYEDIIKNNESTNQTLETDEEKVKKLKDHEIQIRLSYLSLTDWYILREYDQKDSYPEEVRGKRVIVREQINEIEKVSSLKDANLIAANHPFSTAEST
jgi:hypothetical protein